jgi:hypothetical protein
MTKQTITLSDIYNVVNRLEDKMDKRLSLDESRLDVVEASAIENKTRINNFAVFQIAFSALIGAVSAYLGIKK